MLLDATYTSQRLLRHPENGATPKYIRALIEGIFATQAADLKTFREILDSAVQFNMKKLVACCEHCIATDNSGKFNEIFQHFPPQSGVRILECLRRENNSKRSYYSYQGSQLSPKDFLAFEPNKKQNTG